MAHIVGAEFRDREGEGRKRETEIETQRGSFFCMGNVDRRLSTVPETGRTLGLFVEME